MKNFLRLALLSLLAFGASADNIKTDAGNIATGTVNLARLPAIPLTSGVSGILPVANGGTGTATPLASFHTERKGIILIGDSLASHGMGGECSSTCGGTLVITRSGTTATVTASRKVPTGVKVSVVNSNDACYNGLFTSAYQDATHFTYTMTCTPALATSGEVAGGSLTVLYNSVTTDYSWLNWINALTGQYFEVLHSGGAPGSYTTALTQQIATFVTPYPSEFVLMMIGNNDVSLGTANDTIVSNIETAASSIVALGRQVLLSSLAPRNTADGYTQTQINNVLYINQRLKAWASRTAGVYYFDMFSAAVDPTSTTSQWPATTTNYSNSLHPTPLGAYRVASTLATWFQGALGLPTGAEGLVSSAGDLYNINSNTISRQLVRNPLFSGSGGHLTGSFSVLLPAPDPNNVSTGVASGWTVNADQGGGAGTVTTSVASRSDGFGNDQVLTLSGSTATSAAINVYENMDAGFAANDVGQCSVVVGVSGASGLVNVVAYPTIYIGAPGGDTGQYGASNQNGELWSDQQRSQTAAGKYPQNDMTLTLRTPRFTVPSGISNGYFHVFITGDGTTPLNGVFKIGRAACYKMN